MSDSKRGYYPKYIVERADGKEDIDPVYFVLNIRKDTDAMAAALYYAELTENEKLLDDLEALDEKFFG